MQAAGVEQTSLPTPKRPYSTVCIETPGRTYPLSDFENASLCEDPCVVEVSTRTTVLYVQCDSEAKADEFLETLLKKVHKQRKQAERKGTPTSQQDQKASVPATGPTPKERKAGKLSIACRCCGQLDWCYHCGEACTIHMCKKCGETIIQQHVDGSIHVQPGKK